MIEENVTNEGHIYFKVMASKLFPCIQQAPNYKLYIVYLKLFPKGCKLQNMKFKKKMSIVNIIRITCDLALVHSCGRTLRTETVTVGSGLNIFHTWCTFKTPSFIHRQATFHISCFSDENLFSSLT